MEKIDRLHGVVIKAAKELCVGDVILDEGSKMRMDDNKVHFWKGPQHMPVHNLALVGDDVYINDGAVSTSIGNKFLVLADEHGNPLPSWNIVYNEWAQYYDQD